MSGLDNINAESINSLSITNNSLLKTCAVQSICDYLANPSGTITISNNNTGCNTQSEVETACENLSIEELKSNELFKIFPNPTRNKLSIKNTRELIIDEINIFNQLGERIHSINAPGNYIDISILNKGVYFVEIKSSHNIYRQKLIIN